MTPKRTLGLLMAAMILVTAAGIDGGRAQDAPPPEDGLLGSWSGIVLDDAGDEGLVVLDNYAVQDRRYEGWIGLIPPQPEVPPNPVYPVDPNRMTLASNNRVSLISHTASWSLNAYGILAGDTLMLNYHLQFRDGTQSRGLMLLAR